MRTILFYDDSPIFGGHQQTAIVAARAVAAGGNRVAFAHARRNTRLAERLRREADGLEVIALDDPHTRWQPFLAPFGIAARDANAALSSVGPDVVVAVQGTIVQSNRIVEAARRRGTRVVSFIPMGLSFGRNERLFRLAGAILAPFHYKRPDAFITTSRAAQQRLAEQGARGTIRVAFYGPDPHDIHDIPREAARARVGLPEDAFIVAIIGRVALAHKGHDVLLHAVASIRERIPRVMILIVGDGPDDAILERLIDHLGLRDLTVRIPWLDEPALAYSAADIVAIPSRYEGLPLVAMEAMAHRRPVVASDIDGLREVVPAEWRVPPENVAALADAIVNVSTSSSMALIDANERRIVDELNAGTFGEQFRTALDDLSR